jgi:hypothetical protein
MQRALLALVALAAVLAPGAAAGGWATVQLSAVPADGMKAGTDLPIDITVLQHGRTPLEGVTPVFRIRDGGGNLVAEYRGEPADRPGVYHVDVSFPEDGTYRYAVYDGFERYGGARVHQYPPVRIGPGDASFPWLPVGIGGSLVAGALVALLVGLRRLRPAPEAVVQP